MPSSKPILKKRFDIPGPLLFRTLIGKIFGSIGSVGGGLALGKEGPLVHTGAYIASLLGQGGSKYHLNSRWQQFFKSDRDRRDLLELLPLLEEVKPWFFWRQMVINLILYLQRKGTDR
ncbi:Chloride channel core [Arabidopsis suecica]|uniref:Chloride channel core n=1 Tax=Arabidopsis suecica TaxID=45249 RepID=A0A8T2BA33_ARASU|nr:Chloride channel core [Arabidopsis suecica]